MDFQQKLFSPPFFSFFENLGSLYIGYFLAEFYQNIDFPDSWHFEISSMNWNYSMFSVIFISGAYIGTMFGALGSYYLGRIKTLFLADLLTTIAVIMSLINNFTLFFISRFLLGIVLGVNFPTTWIAIREYVFGEEYVVCIQWFQIFNTIGIFLANVVALAGNWMILMMVPMVFSVLRGWYNWLLIKKEIESCLFMIHRRGENENFVFNFWSKLCPKKIDDLREHILKLKNKDTLLKEKFFLGDMFGPDYLKTLIFCFLVFILNQASGINVFLSNASHFYSSNYHEIINPVIFSLVNMIGGLLLLVTVPKSKFSNGRFGLFFGITLYKGFLRFVLGAVCLCVFHGFFAFVFDFQDGDEYVAFMNVGCLYIIVFQQTIGAYPCLYTAYLLPDVGVYIVLGFNYIFSLCINLLCALMNDPQGTINGIFQVYLSITVAGAILILVVFHLWMKGKWREQSLDSGYNDNNFPKITIIIDPSE